MSSPPDWFRRLVLGEKKVEQPVARHVFPEFDVEKYVCTSVPPGKRVVQNGYEFVVTDDGVWYMVKEPSMAEAGVKVEVVEPKPQRKYRLVWGNPTSIDEVDEETARAIYEGLAEHFTPKYCKEPFAALAEKDAEIARLKALNPSHVYCNAKYHEHKAEIYRLRGWLEKIHKREADAYLVERKSESGNDARRALAGEKVPE